MGEHNVKSAIGLDGCLALTGCIPVDFMSSSHSSTVLHKNINKNGLQPSYLIDHAAL